MLDFKMLNIAVVGAGIGGCSAAYFARKLFPSMKLTIYDSKNRIGGRILTCNIAGLPIELGAAFFNRINRTLLDILETEKLETTPVERMNFAVWNGSKFVFRSNKESLTTFLKLLLKYRLSLTRTYLLLRKVSSQVARLYQEERKNPTDIRQIFESIHIDKWQNKTFCEVLKERNINQAFIDEIATPITRIIYSQNEDLGAFAGLSSLIGIYSGETYSLAEGNSILPIHLVRASNATMKMGKKVDAIEKTSEGNYRVHAENDAMVFDSVIIATPLELADIKFDGLSLERCGAQTYQSVYRSAMRGVFNPEYFNLNNSIELPHTILTTKETGPITQYSIQKVSHGESVVTISSTEPINIVTFNDIFKSSPVSVFDYCWKAAYPIFKPLNKLPPTRIDKGLMYLNAIEPAVSSMETSVLSAKNAVQMLLAEKLE
jgi:prenylcysteine oxidase/farnesylcysteine lyase